MSTIEEIEAAALQLTEDERAALAASLLGSLPAVLSDDDLGAAEALRRDAEMDRDHRASITMEELLRAVGR